MFLSRRARGALGGDFLMHNHLLDGCDHRLDLDGVAITIDHLAGTLLRHRNALAQRTQSIQGCRPH